MHAHACDYIRSNRRGSRIEVQGARPGPGKLLCSREPCADELYGYSLPVLALAMITTLMALQIGYLLGLRLGVEVVDNFRDHVALIAAGIYLTLLAEIVLVLGYAVWQEWRQNSDFRPNIWDDF